jgi:phosphoserine aminotransferase
MKFFLLIPLFCVMIFGGTQYYVIRDRSGSIIAETRDLSVLKVLSNVSVDTVESWDGMKMSIIDFRKVDALKDSMVSRYAPKTAVYHYSLEWCFDNGGVMKLVKSARDNQGLLSYDWKAENWLKAQDFVDVLVPTRLRSDSLILVSSTITNFQGTVFNKVSRMRSGEKVTISTSEVDTGLVTMVVDSLVGLGYGVRSDKSGIFIQKQRFQNR